MYECKQCGSCCRNLSGTDIYRELDRGDGICVYLKNNKCTIYYKRPIICRIDDFYSMYLTDIMTKKEYYDKNMKACLYLNEKERF